MKIKKFKIFIESIAGSDHNLEIIKRCEDISEDQLFDIFYKNCKNFSFDNDQLYRGKSGSNLFQLYQPNYRNARPVAFLKFFNKIEKDPNYPVVRKKSLIGGTNVETIKLLTGCNPYLVIPFDNIEIIFAPVMDLWAMDDDRRMGSEKISGKDIGPEHFVKTTYTKNFKIPFDDLEKIKHKNIDILRKRGAEFFISSPCLLIHPSKIEWFKNNI